MEDIVWIKNVKCKIKPMRLKEYNPNVLMDYQSSMPQIRVSGNGNIYVNMAAINLMAGTKYNSIVFHQDQDKLSDWYISEAEKGFLLKQYNGHKTMYFISKKLREKISESVGNKDKAFAFRVMPKQLIDGGFMYKLVLI